ncbi:hypothetical protein [Paenibacillus sp. PastF-1]|nr:hypothetical protein [Paenibacillus sp. PastF-1]
MEHLYLMEKPLPRTLCRLFQQIAAQWVDFASIHEERHLAQLKEALAVAWVRQSKKWTAQDTTCSGPLVFSYSAQPA